ncbi:lantibiotic dehydratase [Paenibacillus sp. FSL F4-0236]|uniref:lantibiotic dehydratase n=1 Tax=Paenibacillus sp. FSL F4-0236 TaxID=2954731 RepID=UPI0030FAB18C
MKGVILFMRGSYQSCGFYMLRTPILPIEFYKRICFPDDVVLQKELEKIMEIKEIREAIQVGSISLYNRLDQINDKVSSSVLKYLIRMSTRTTPYGLFSGINIGHFDTYSSIQLNNKKKFKKRMRPDMEWLYGVINNIGENREFVKFIKVKKNSLAYQIGDRLENPYVSNFGIINEKEGELATSIRWTNLLELVMEHTQEFVEMRELVHIILEKYSHVKEEKVYEYLEKLLSYEYLITNLRPPLTEVNLFEYVVNQVKGIVNANELYDQLECISQKINEYNTQSIGDSMELLSDIIKNMENLFKTTNYVQIDTGITTSKNVLNRSVSEDIEKYCCMLQKLGVSQLEDNNIKAYKEEFLEIYGVDMEVQLLELLDEGIGLGAPAGYSNPLSRKKHEPALPNDKVKRIAEFIKYKIIEANVTHNDIIQLTDEDVEEMSGDSDIPKDEEFSPSIELNVIISAKSCEDVDKGKYLLFIGPNFGSNKAGKTYGRFMDIINKDEAQQIKSEIYEKEKAVIDNEYIMVELSELLQYGRGNNVTINSNNIEYQLCIATNSVDTKKTIDIKDLYVGVYKNKFYVKSKSLNKKVLITYHHMMNYKNGSNIGRFLKDISSGYYSNLLDIAMMFQFENFMRLPRVMYENIVLIPLSWRIKKENFDLSSNEKFEKGFKDWMKKNKVPRYIYQKDYDNRLLFDLHSPTHTKELFNIIKKSKDTVLLTETELGLDIDSLIVRDESANKYSCEVVIPLIRKPIEAEKNFKNNTILESIQTKSIISSNMNKISFQAKQRNLFPGDENWYYYKFYITEIRINELLGDYVYDFCELLVEKKLISKYFFIRYADPKIHIRLRVQVTEENDHLVQKYFTEFLKKLNTKGLVHSMQTENYFREIERYGGAEIMQDAEEYFYADSQYVGQLTKLIREKEIEYKDEQIAIISIISIMEHFNVSFEDQEQLFSNIIDRTKYHNYYKKNRKEYMLFANWEEFCSKRVGIKLHDLIRKKQEQTMKYRQAVDNLDQHGSLCNSKESILLSIIHMFCNRFKGDREWESLIMSLVGHSLYDLKLFKKAKQKKHVTEGSYV